MTVCAYEIDGQRVEVTGTGYAAAGDFKIDGQKVEQIINVDSEGPLQLALRIGVLCNDAELDRSGEGVRVLGDPTEAALLVAAEKAGLHARNVCDWHALVRRTRRRPSACCNHYLHDTGDGAGLPHIQRTLTNALGVYRPPVYQRLALGGNADLRVVATHRCVPAVAQGCPAHCTAHSGRLGLDCGRFTAAGRCCGVGQTGAAQGYFSFDLVELSCLNNCLYAQCRHCHTASKHHRSIIVIPPKMKAAVFVAPGRIVPGQKSVPDVRGVPLPRQDARGTSRRSAT